MNGLQPSALAMNCPKKRRMEEGILMDMDVKENLNRGKNHMLDAAILSHQILM